jgi:hypothetical protein
MPSICRTTTDAASDPQGLEADARHGVLDVVHRLAGAVVDHRIGHRYDPGRQQRVGLHQPGEFVHRTVGIVDHPLHLERQFRRGREDDFAGLCIGDQPGDDFLHVQGMRVLCVGDVCGRDDYSRRVRPARLVCDGGR